MFFFLSGIFLGTIFYPIIYFILQVKYHVYRNDNNGVRFYVNLVWLILSCIVAFVAFIILAVNEPFNEYFTCGTAIGFIFTIAFYGITLSCPIGKIAIYKIKLDYIEHKLKRLDKKELNKEQLAIYQQFIEDIEFIKKKINDLIIKDIQDDISRLKKI